LLAGLNAQQPQAVWEFLPRSYQADVNVLLHEFANRMDIEIWNRSFEIAERAVVVLEQQRDHVFASRFWSPPPESPRDQLQADWDASVQLLATLIRSDLADLEKVRSLDVGQFLTSTGGEVLIQLSRMSKLAPGDPLNSQLEQLAAMKVTAVLQSDDDAVVTFTSTAPENPTRNVEFVRVDEKWIPRELAANWEPTKDRLREWLADIAENEDAKRKAAILARLDEVERLLVKIERAETPAQFEAEVEQAVVVVTSWWESQPIRTPSTIPAGLPSERDRVRVVVQTELDAAAEDAITAELIQLTDQPELSYAISSSGDGITALEIWPVNDVAAFAERIEFGKVTAIDQDKRNITVAVGP
jgi:hypothetical protein